MKRKLKPNVFVRFKNIGLVIVISARFFEPSSSLNRLYSSLPHAVYCSDDKTARYKLSKKKAVSFPYLQVNSKNLKNWLVFDLDHDNPMIWDDEHLPAPNFIVRSRDNSNTSHLYYAIPGVATSANGRAAPIAYMKAVYEAMAIRLNADLAYSGPVAKTPGHPWWHTTEIHNHEYDLGELADYVDLETKPQWSKGPDLDSVSHSRNCTLFEVTRFYAYAKVDAARRDSTLARFEQQIYSFATAKNRFKAQGWQANLRDSEIKATAKSIARWTWDFYRGAGKHRGVMGLSDAIPLESKQRMSAERTARVKRDKTLIQITNAVRDLVRAKTKLTQLAVAAATGLTRQTIAKYYALAIKEARPGQKLVALFKRAKNVNLGRYQIGTIFTPIPGASPDRSNSVVCLRVAFRKNSLHVKEPPDFRALPNYPIDKTEKQVQRDGHRWTSFIPVAIEIISKTMVPGSELLYKAFEKESNE
ncbi:replication initiation protein [Alteromonas macleodii]|uniref:Replicase family protein n=1 Tax=Alteromonas macleodii TaxID=28108 RepID=A0AB36FL71_ALTMA|nr:replication initiation protein [Alteromonas macleodii]OES24623.1 replicase family protein [Alteromonas macleodii]OES25375.1 replicase family protein [Alteromonas macleodii]OES25384.1 replicase family protein [Alteromonas macleodii]OES38689.1 replicase family protein [Alteromonas macleodii]